MKILAGFKYKPNHVDIHFISNESGEESFSRDIKTATRFATQAEATRAIYEAISGFAEDDDYEWTPILVDEEGKELSNIRPFFKVGSPQFKEQDLPHFLNLPG